MSSEQPPKNEPPPSSEYSAEWVRSLPPAERAALIKATTPRLNKYIPQAPTPPQAAFLLLETREALYGGACGGGKSSALLMAALQYVDVPGYAAYIFRRTFADLAKPGALIPRSHEWLANTDADWRGDTKSWHFPSGAVLAFGYLEHENDKYNYQGTEAQFCGFDEATQFSETQYRYLFSRLRRLEGSPVPIRTRGATNPGGVGHEWVRQRFLVEGKGAGRVFVPARLEDNPHLDRDDYELSLANLDPITRAQLRNGDWEIREKGPLFDRAWFEIIDAAPEGVRWLRWWDLAATAKRQGTDPDWTAGAKVGEKAGVFYIQDVRRRRDSPLLIEQWVSATAQADGRRVEVWMEQEPGSAGVIVVDHYARNVLKGFPYYGERSTGDKVTYAKPLSAAAQKGNVKLVRGPWIGEFLDELEPFPREGIHDDQVDAVSKAFVKLSQGPSTGWL